MAGKDAASRIGWKGCREPCRRWAKDGLGKGCYPGEPRPADRQEGPCARRLVEEAPLRGALRPTGPKGAGLSWTRRLQQRRDKKRHHRAGLLWHRRSGERHREALQCERPWQPTCAGGCWGRSPLGPRAVGRCSPGKGTRTPHWRPARMCSRRMCVKESRCPRRLYVRGIPSVMDRGPVVHKWTTEQASIREMPCGGSRAARRLKQATWPGRMPRAVSAGKDAASRAAAGRKTDSGRAAIRASPDRLTARRARAPDAW